MVKKLEIFNSRTNEFNCLGISCHLKDYRICHYINNALNLNLSKSTDIEIYNKKFKRSLKYSFYYFCRDGVEYYLASNKGETNSFITEFKNIDYIFLYTESSNDNMTECYTKKIRNISNVLTTINIDLNKSLSNILTDIEIHLMNFKSDKNN